MARAIPEVARELEKRVAELGYELVEVEWAGSSRRPIVRLRVDRPNAVPGETGITVDDCAAVSRGLEPWLDELRNLPETYVLEVSSPGVERPLVRVGDFRRFAGESVAVKGSGPLVEGMARRLEGELLGVVGDDEAPRVQLRLPSGEEVEIEYSAIRGAHVIYHWK